MSSEEIKIHYTKKELPTGFSRLGFILLIFGLILVILSFITDYNRATQNSVIIFTFLTSISIGSLFLVALEYIAGAVWSVPFRRISEIISFIIFLIPLFALPSLLNFHGVFHWSHQEAVANDKLLQVKAPYLNETFFIIRNIAIFLIWILFYKFLTGNSRKQDSTYDQKFTSNNIKLSAAFMPIFGISLTIIAIDWLMSLEPHWFSTIFGVYYFSGTILSALACLTLMVLYLNEKGLLVKGLTKDHYYSLGALMFAFINFWAYIAFSQFMLIWYANLPEETFWFITRWQGGWSYLSYGLIFIHFVIPYAILLPQPAKMDPLRLKIASVIILIAHFYDLYWLSMPSFSKDVVIFSWYEIAFPILAVGLFITVFSIKSKKINLVPVGDPKMKRALEFKL